MENREDILKKIQKCMSLANSANEHEAAAALRQATKLMAMYEVSEAEMLASSVSEVRVKSGVIAHPSRWESDLAGRIAYIFGCHLMFSEGFSESVWIFIGISPNNDVAGYSFDVLYRQAKRARQEFITTQLKRFKKSNKVRRADLFCVGWVRAACAGVTALTPIKGAEAAIAAYMDLKHADVGKLEVRDRNSGPLSHKDALALSAGLSAGRNAQVHRGVGAAEAPLMLGRG
jgi:hypothetical protein